MAFPVKVNITIYQGSTYEHRFDVLDGTSIYDLTGFSARMQFRATVDAATTLYEATSADDLVIDGPAGTVTVLIPDETSEAWAFTRAVYDLEIEAPTGEAYRIAEGSVKVRPEVTR